MVNVKNKVMTAYEKFLHWWETGNMGKKMAEQRESDDESVSGTAAYLVSHNLIISGRRTTVRLEDEMWAALKDVAEYEGCTVNDVAGRISGRKKKGQSFTSAIRVFLMQYYRNAAR
jgi:predicted DNA-binding ribbon-helix-helix protein